MENFNVLIVGEMRENSNNVKLQGTYYSVSSSQSGSEVNFKYNDMAQSLNNIMLSNEDEINKFLDKLKNQNLKNNSLFLGTSLSKIQLEDLTYYDNKVGQTQRGETQSIVKLRNNPEIMNLKNLKDYTDNYLTVNIDAICINNLVVLAELLTCDDSELPNCIKDNTMILVYRSIVFSRWAGKNMFTEGYYGKTIKYILEIIKPLTNKPIKLNRVTKYLLGKLGDSSYKNDIIKLMATKDAKEGIIVALSSSNSVTRSSISINDIESKIKFENKEILDIVNKSYEKRKTLNTIASTVNSLKYSKKYLSDKDILDALSNFYANSKGKNLVCIEILIPTLTKKQIEKIGVERVTNYLTKTKQTNALTLLDEKLSVSLDAEEKLKIARLNRYKIYAMSKPSFGAFMTYINLEETEFIKKHAKIIGKTLVDACVKLGYYCLREDGFVFDNAENIAIISEAFCDELNTRKITVINNILSNAYNDSRWGTDAYKKLLSAVNIEKHTKLAEAKAERLMK